MAFHDLINAAADRLQLGGGVDAKAQALDIQFQDDHPVRIEHHDSRGQISLAGVIGFYPPQAQQARLFETLLQAQLYGLLTDGCAFSVDADASKILLFKTLPLDGLDADGLVRALGDFRLVQQTWRKAYADGKLTAQDAPAPAGAAPAVSPAINLA
ncbi:MAG: type III secretion system chaperone [Achromobacter sp.]|uniref:type III secretion system chaperone n=1 Tax=Achromobacter sp. TaxID=134375 RepID=UPI003D08060E